MKNYSLLATTILTASLVSGAACAENVWDWQHVGEDNAATIVQTGDLNYARLVQNGNGNSANIEQIGIGNTFIGTDYAYPPPVERQVATQYGDNNHMNVRVHGNSNRVGVDQGSHFADGRIAYRSNNSDAVVNVTGDNNNAYMFGLTNSFGNIDIIGNNNFAYAAGAGYGSTTSEAVVQNGNNNDARVITDAHSRSEQHGDYNTVYSDLRMGLCGIGGCPSNRADSFQHGNHNYIFQSIGAYASTLRTAQNGNDNELNIRGFGSMLFNVLQATQTGNDNQATMYFGHNIQTIGNQENNRVALNQQGSDNVVSMNLFGASWRMNNIDLTQLGSNNQITTSTQTNMNSIDVNQQSNSNIANITQNGISNIANIAQVGNSTAQIQQIGDNNRGEAIFRNSTSNRGNIAITGSRNVAAVTGTGNVGSGNNMLLTTITGNDNHADAVSSGDNETFTMSLTGNNNTAAISSGNGTLPGNIPTGNQVNITQEGLLNNSEVNTGYRNNEINILQLGFVNDAQVDQVGNDNHANILGVGLNNSATIDQEGSNHVASIEQYGLNHRMTIIQRD